MTKVAGKDLKMYLIFRDDDCILNLKTVKNSFDFPADIRKKFVERYKIKRLAALSKPCSCLKFILASIAIFYLIIFQVYLNNSGKHTAELKLFSCEAFKCF